MRYPTPCQQQQAQPPSARRAQHAGAMHELFQSPEQAPCIEAPDLSNPLTCYGTCQPSANQPTPAQQQQAGPLSDQAPSDNAADLAEAIETGNLGHDTSNTAGEGDAMVNRWFGGGLV